jgi:hypothetical protein
LLHGVTPPVKEKLPIINAIMERTTYDTLPFPPIERTRPTRIKMNKHLAERRQKRASQNLQYRHEYTQEVLIGNAECNKFVAELHGELRALKKEKRVREKACNDKLEEKYPGYKERKEGREEIKFEKWLYVDPSMERTKPNEPPESV